MNVRAIGLVESFLIGMFFLIGYAAFSDAVVQRGSEAIPQGRVLVSDVSDQAGI